MSIKRMIFFSFTLEEVPSLGQLPNLKSLYLCNLTNVKSIGSSLYGPDKRGNNIFPMLKRLELEDVPNLKEWDEAASSDEPSGVVVFPCLQHLMIKRCDQLMRAPSHFPCLKKLKMHEMESRLPLENICGMKLTTLTHLKIRGIKELECLPDGLFSNNRNLWKLKIRDCPNMTHLVPLLLLRGGGGPSLRKLVIWDCLCLRELPDDFHSLNSLETLVIWGCPELKSIPSPYPRSREGQQQQEHSFSSLKVLCICDCGGLTNLPIEILESCALSLERLRLEGLSSLNQNASEVIGRCLPKMTRLTSLDIREVPKFSIIISSAFQNHDLKTVVSSLESLNMVPDSSWNNVSFNETVDDMLLQFTSLRHLTLHGKKHWDCRLPDGIQRLTLLQELELQDFGIEALPEWFGNLSSLEELRIWNCNKLRHLPSKQAMQRGLSKLTRSVIAGSPLLLKGERIDDKNPFECSQIVDSERHKISHIPYIFVDG